VLDRLHADVRCALDVGGRVAAEAHRHLQLHVPVEAQPQDRVQKRSDRKQVHEVEVNRSGNGQCLDGQLSRGGRDDHRGVAGRDGRIAHLPRECCRGGVDRCISILVGQQLLLPRSNPAALRLVEQSGRCLRDECGRCDDERRHVSSQPVRQRRVQRCECDVLVDDQHAAVTRLRVRHRPVHHAARQRRIVRLQRAARTQQHGTASRGRRGAAVSCDRDGPASLPPQSFVSSRAHCCTPHIAVRR
jgi:hypothetical protein